MNRVRAGEITRSRSNARGGEGRARARGDGWKGREEHFLEARSEANREANRAVTVEEDAREVNERLTM